MQHKQVNSSAIKSIGFDPTSNTMEVTFHTGKTATHAATKQEYEALLNAPSIGAHYSQSFKIKKQVFVNRKMIMKR